MRDAIWNFVTSPEFLVGGLVFGFVVNLLSSYMKEGIDRKLAQYSAVKKEKNEALTKMRRKRVQRMTYNDRELMLMCYAEHRMVTAAVFTVAALGLLMSVGFFLTLSFQVKGRGAWDERMVYFINGLLVLTALVLSANMIALVSRGKRLREDINKAVLLSRDVDPGRDDDEPTPNVQRAR